MIVKVSVSMSTMNFIVDNKPNLGLHMYNEYRAIARVAKHLSRISSGGSYSSQSMTAHKSSPCDLLDYCGNAYMTLQARIPSHGLRLHIHHSKQTHG